MAPVPAAALTPVSTVPSGVLLPSAVAASSSLPLLSSLLLLSLFPIFSLVVRSRKLRHRYKQDEAYLDCLPEGRSGGHLWGTA